MRRRQFILDTYQSINHHDNATGRRCDVGNSGSAAFTPNPVQATSGTTIAWKNNTGVLHHIVMDSGTVIGDVAAGATVNATVSGSGGNYHCTTHPTMVGSINGASAPPAPTPNASGGYDY